MSEEEEGRAWVVAAEGMAAVSIAVLVGWNKVAAVVDRAEGTLLAAGREIEVVADLVVVPSCGRALEGQGRTVAVAAALNTAGCVADTGRWGVELGKSTAATLHHYCCPW